MTKQVKVEVEEDVYNSVLSQLIYLKYSKEDFYTHNSEFDSDIISQWCCRVLWSHASTNDVGAALKTTEVQVVKVEGEMPKWKRLKGRCPSGKRLRGDIVFDSDGNDSRCAGS